MRSTFSISLALLISFQAFYNAGVLAFWVANQTRIAATLCENRDKPDLHCEGKCYLKKKIADAPDAPARPTKPLPIFKKGIEVAIAPPVSIVFPKTHSFFERAVLISKTPDFSPFVLAKAIFHPPSSPFSAA